RQFVLSLKSLPDFAKQCGCSERTLGNMLAGKPVDRETVKVVADKLQIKPWYLLISDTEKVRQGLGTSDASPPITTADQSAKPVLPRSVVAGFNRLLQIPKVLSDFIGRADQIAALSDRLRGNGGPVKLSALHGMGGIGKTSLAVRV